MRRIVARSRGELTGARNRRRARRGGRNLRNGDMASCGGRSPIHDDSEWERRSSSAERMRAMRHNAWMASRGGSSSRAARSQSSDCKAAAMVVRRCAHVRERRMEKERVGAGGQNWG
ncbi:hypothetical protein PR202_ga22008 [Eleusine coracana subsp. coracana]|uniref:Uncharacterized protein n=1 Tax=Eleusine coracana subsp. coracana TaxID=191504 RepID=A0AAV5D295_ELECO|nr:hypothetical protein PR202_ga22008 [Eleusine coracana subsp. coracana]